MESGASLDPQVSVLCVWRLPPKGSRSVRHEPHATHGQPSARSSSRVTTISSPARAYICVGRVGLRRDASASPSSAPKGSSSSGAARRSRQPLRRFHADGLGGAREGPLPGALDAGRRRVDAVSRNDAAPAPSKRRAGEPVVEARGAARAAVASTA